MKDHKAFKHIKNKYLTKLLREFNTASQAYYWECDQGNEVDAKYALADYQLCKTRLVNYLNKKLVMP